MNPKLVPTLQRRRRPDRHVGLTLSRVPRRGRIHYHRLVLLQRNERQRGPVWQRLGPPAQDRHPRGQVGPLRRE